MKKTGKEKAGGKWINILLVAILLVGVGLLLYPTVADQWNKIHQSRAITKYADVVASINNEEYDRILAAAREYNERLAESGIKWSLTAEEEEEYLNTLDVTGDGVLGYIEIEKIKCYLPIYHGVEEAVLQTSIGHIPGTSLPVGGESSHAVLSGHRGLPSARLFTDLDKMELGDTFIIRVLDEIETYEVDQIVIVEPADLSLLKIEDGEDYVTLVTCTPYGVNTHRMLVRGHRVENRKNAKNVRVTADAMQIESNLVAACLAIPTLIILILYVYLKPKKNRKKKNKKQDKTQ